MSFSINTAAPLLQAFDSEVEHEENSDISNSHAGTFIDKPLEPRDKFWASYLMFYYLGIVTLIPWNFFVTADDYWMYKFRDITNETGLLLVPKRTPLQASFTSYINVASAVPTLLFLILNTALNEQISLNKRIIGSLVCMQALFIVTQVFVVVDTDRWQQQFFIITLVTIVLLNMCSAILCGSLFTVIGRFSPIYITALTGGQALGGSFAAIAQIISLALGASSVHSALFYFIIGNVAILASIVCYMVLSNSLFFSFHVTESTDLRNVRPTINRKAIFKKMWIYGTSAFIAFTFTMAVFPGLTVLIESEGKGHGNKWNDVFFVPTIAYLLFNAGDYMGRILAGRFLKPRKSGMLLVLSMSRFVFIPLLMLCNAQPRHNLAVVFDKDYEYILILFCCAITNGYLVNITTICVPRYVDHHERETASAMMSVFVGVGLTAGSFISLVLVKLL